MLYGHEVGEYAEEDGAADYHYQQPEVQLRFWPFVFAPALDEADHGFVGHCVRR